MEIQTAGSLVGNFEYEGWLADTVSGGSGISMQQTNSGSVFQIILQLLHSTLILKLWP